MELKIISLDNDIKTLGIETDNIPAGIPAAFDELKKLLGSFDGYDIYGVTECGGNKLVYYACAGESAIKENVKHKLKHYTIPKGEYLYAVLKDWQNHIEQIAKIFDDLMRQPGVNKNTICVEYYKTPADVLLMVQPA